MQIQDVSQNRVRRSVNDLVLAEMFLLQATIESATVIGDGFSELGKQIGDSETTGKAVWESISSTLQRIADDALEPYKTRFNYFREVIDKES